MPSVPQRFLELAKQLAAALHVTESYADWIALEAKSSELEQTRLQLGLPEALEKSPAALIVTVNKTHAPEHCDENLQEILQRFTEADITWHALISSNPVDAPGDFFVTPLYRDEAENQIALSPHRPRETRCQAFHKDFLN